MTDASPTSTKRRPRVLLGVTGSVAAVKGPEIAVRLVRDLQVDVRVLLTAGGLNFWSKAKEYNPAYWKELEKRVVDTKETGVVEDTGTEGRLYIHSESLMTCLFSFSETRLASLPSCSLIIIAADEEWKGWNRLGDPVLHIDLRDWADVCVLAPLSAHTLAKLANGLCDDTLSCVLRAWDYGHGERPGKPIILAPAMNTAMWEHPLTRAQLTTIQSFWNLEKNPQNGIRVVEPQVKTLACGEVGTGALASVNNIIEAVNKCCSSSL